MTPKPTKDLHSYCPCPTALYLCCYNSFLTGLLTVNLYSSSKYILLQLPEWFFQNTGLNTRCKAITVASIYTTIFGCQNRTSHYLSKSNYIDFEHPVGFQESGLLLRVFFPRIVQKSQEVNKARKCGESPSGSIFVTVETLFIQLVGQIIPFKIQAGHKDLSPRLLCHSVWVWFLWDQHTAAISLGHCVPMGAQEFTHGLPTSKHSVPSLSGGHWLPPQHWKTSFSQRNQFQSSTLNPVCWRAPGLAAWSKPFGIEKNPDPGLVSAGLIPGLGLTSQRQRGPSSACAGSYGSSFSRLLL